MDSKKCRELILDPSIVELGVLLSNGKVRSVLGDRRDRERF